MKTPEEIADAIMNSNYGPDSTWGEPNRYGESGFTLALVMDAVPEERVRALLTGAIEADRAQRDVTVVD